MARNEEPSHPWFTHRLEALAAGILETAEELRVRTHITQCPECRESLEGMRPELAEAGSGHVPSSVLGRWPAVGESMPPLERKMVERHLGRCSACREDLALAGAPGLSAGSGERRSGPGATAGWLRLYALAATLVALALAVLWWSALRR